MARRPQRDGEAEQRPLGRYAPPRCASSSGGPRRWYGFPPTSKKAVLECGDTVVICARSRAEPAACTGCGRSSDWEHSRYVRHVEDEAVGGRPVRIDLSVRRLYCENAACPKTTFAEQIEGLTLRCQRRTPGLQLMVAAVATALAGKAGSRLLFHLHHALSWASLLAWLMKCPDPPTLTLRATARSPLRHPRDRRVIPSTRRRLQHQGCRTHRRLAACPPRHRGGLPRRLGLLPCRDASHHASHTSGSCPLHSAAARFHSSFGQLSRRCLPVSRVFPRPVPTAYGPLS
ncbi:transposase family protein [Streptomyces sp. NPDC016845]|uniref:transposase family protein n=1 Tax=Streptomyces sp. NPDC016845 TaxID=3364972 RepID=UPI0037BDA10F